MLKNICVYCGASEGRNIEYKIAAHRLGKTLAEQGRRLIYGGGKRGLMGTIADAVLAHGGEVIGIIPERLVIAETAHPHLTQLEVVNNMQTRKARMAELADAFISLPGGTGTLEELYETWTAYQVGYHQKPVSILNVNNYYQHMQSFLHHAVNEGFINNQFFNTLIISTSISDLLIQLDEYTVQDNASWLKK